MSEFRTEIYIIAADGEEHEIPVTVDYDAEYDPGRVTGPWEDCYPPSGDMTINSIEPVGEWPDGITLNMVSDMQLDFIKDDAWNHYFRKGVDDDA